MNFVLLPLLATILWFFTSSLTPIQAADVLEKYEPHIYKNNAGEQLLYRLHKPSTDEHDSKLPLVVFLHGSGERGDDNKAQLKHAASELASQSHDCFVVAPQCPRNQRWVEVDWSGKDHKMAEEPGTPLKLVSELIDHLSDQYPVDKKRIYITGLSMGGFGTWEAIQRWPDRFAAAIPVCGGGDLRHAKTIASVPLWVFHGAKDTVVIPERSSKMVAAIKAAGGNPRYTEYPAAGHNSWTATYREPAVYEWLFAQSK